MTRIRGVTLGTTLLVAMLVAMLGLCLAGGSLSHLHLVSHSDTSTQALDLARSAMATAIARLQSGHNLPDVRVTAGPGEGLLSFGPQADKWEIPRSLDNLAGDSSRPGLDGKPLPAYSSQLVAVGRVGHVERKVEALVHLPVFPYAAASEGPMQAPGPLLVGRDVSGELWPASLRSNADLQLGAGSHVAGDLVASGSISAPANEVRVDGLVRPGQPRETLSRIPLTSFDPEVLKRPSNALASTLTSVTLSGINRASGDVTVNGDLRLKDALIFVEGDLDVRGTLEGTGLLVTTGDLTLTGHGQLTAETRLGLAAGGKLSVLGLDHQRSKLKGTLYAEAGLDLAHVTIEGVVVNVGVQGASFDECSILYDDQVAGLMVSGPASSPSSVTIFVTQHRVDTVLEDESQSHVSVTIEKVSEGRFRYLQWYASYYGNGVAKAEEQSSGRPLGALAQEIERESGRVPGIAVDPGSVEKKLNEIFYPTASETASDPLPVKLDPSQVLPLADRFRVMLWEEP